jgi:hypothetical protein
MKPIIEYALTDKEKLSVALHLLLDSVDYTLGNCRPNEMVGSVLGKETIKRVRDIMEECRDND